MPSRKQRAIKNRTKRKRKGFMGSHYQTETLQMKNVGCANTDCNSSYLGPLQGRSTPTKETEANEVSLSYIVDGTNVSHRKLQNSSFEELDEREGHHTRSTTRKLGLPLRPREEEKADCYILQDVDVLVNALSSIAMCKSCKSAKSNLHLLRKEKKRNGLAEFLIWRCDTCKAEVKFYSSKQVGGKSGGSFEINRRSVAACNAIKGGRQTLANFCGIMNLPPPVHGNAYALHLSELRKQQKKRA